MEKKQGLTKHELLAKKIKNSVAKGMKDSFLDAAEALSAIKEGQTYKTTKPDDDKYTFEKYCLETDYLPGSTPNGRRSVASKLLLINQFYKSKRIDKDTLLSIGYTKSYELAKYGRKHSNADIGRAIKLAHDFSYNDFTKMLYERDCQHKEVITVKMCKKCKQILEIIK